MCMSACVCVFCHSNRHSHDLCFCISDHPKPQRGQPKIAVTVQCRTIKYSATCKYHEMSAYQMSLNLKLLPYLVHEQHTKNLPFTVLSIIQGHLCFQSRHSSSLFFQKLVTSGVPRNFVQGGGGSTISVKDRGQRERGSGGGSSLVSSSGGGCNLVQEFLFHIVKFSSFLIF